MQNDERKAELSASEIISTFRTITDGWIAELREEHHLDATTGEAEGPDREERRPDAVRPPAGQAAD